MGEDDDYSWMTDLFSGGGDQQPVSGYDIPSMNTGGGAPTSFNVGPGQNASDIYSMLQQAGLLTPGADLGTSTIPGQGGASKTGGMDLTSLIKALGGNSGLLAALASIGGGLYSANRTNKATSQTLAGINDAKNQVSSILGPGAGIGGAGIYSPYMNAGTTALGKLGGFNYQPLAPQFGNLSTGGVNALPKQLTLGTMGGK